MKGRVKTQKELVREYLEAGKALTPAKALAQFGSFRLAAVIHKLKQEGMDIISTRNTDAVGRQYAEYRLAGGA